MRFSLYQQLILALIIPAFAVIGAMAWVADTFVHQALEEALGARLISAARGVAAVTDPRLLLLERGDDESRTAKNALKKLTALTEAAEIERVVLVRLADQKVLLDTSGALKIGDDWVRASFDKAELDRVAAGQSTSSVLFKGAGDRWYKAGFAAIREPIPDSEEAGPVRAAVVVDAPARFFEAIQDLRVVSIAIAAAGFVALFGLALLSARGVTRPLSALSRAAERIGEGELGAEIPGGGPKETVILSETMQKMARSIFEREEEMQIMLAGIAHEVRNPLGGIELFGGLLKEDLEPSDPRQKHVDKILKQIGVLSGVVNDFLDFARKRPVELVPHDLAELLADVLALTEKDAAAKSVTLSLEAEKPLTAKLDKDALHRAVLNLVKNAIQAVPEGGRVKISAQKQAEFVEIIVADNGPGVPPEARENVFRPFFTTKQKGTGLGLALVKKAVDGHKGSIAIEETPGGGASFRLKLPAPDAP
ncbi:MAG: HAMP domain-containing sensor histidine kinase [Myxococcota bacterium]